MVMSPQVSWLFFKARAKRPYLSHTGRASKAEKQPTGRGPEGCVENGPARGNVSAYRRIGVSAFAEYHQPPSRPPNHHSHVEKRTCFPRRRYANTPTRFPSRRPILNATTSPLYARRYTR